MVSTLPAAILEFALLGDSPLDGAASLTTVAAGMFFVVGPVEEISKFLAVRILAANSLYFDEPMDGLVYAAAASLGFASLENLMYVVAFGPWVMVLRAPLSTLAHVIFGSFWGFPLGRKIQVSPRRFWWGLPVGITAAAIVHGFFNTLLFSFWPMALVLVGGGLWWTLGRFRWAQNVSPFRYRRNYPRVGCANCGQLISVLSNFCRYCGAPANPSPSELYCSHCGFGNNPIARFCTECGDGLLR